MSKTRKTLLSTYHYDPLDRLSGTNATQRFYNSTRIAMEIEGDRKTRFFETDSQPLALQQHGSAPGATLLATDLQTSVLSGIGPDDNPHAQAFTPFGHHANDALLSVIGFNGERPDPVTGHYLLGQGYRAFNPVLMRFNSPDSWSPFGKGGINTYAYCDNDPFNKADPTGHVPFFIRKFIASVTPAWIRRRPARTTHNVGDSSLGPRISLVSTSSLSSLEEIQTAATATPLLTPNYSLVDTWLARSNLYSGVPPTPDGLHIVNLNEVRQTTAFLNAHAPSSRQISLQALAASKVPDFQLSNLPSDVREKILKPLLIDKNLSEFQQAFNSQSSVPGKQKFLTLLPKHSPDMFALLPGELRTIIRGG